MSVISSLLVAVGVDPSGVGKGLGEADTRIGKFAGGMAKTGALLTTGITAPVIALGGFALKAALDVDEAYDTIRAGTGATGKALESLQGSFDKVAKKVPADLADVGTTIADLNTRLGSTGPTLEKLSMQILEAGRLGGVPVDIKNVTGAFSVFNVTGKDTTTAMDEIFRVSQATGVGINDLSAIMAKNGGILSQLGFGFAESASMIGVLDKAGINSRAVMSSMSAGLVKLAEDGEKPSDAFRRVAGRLQELIGKGKDAKALDLAGEIFGTRGAGQFVAALKSGKVNLDDLTKSAGMSKDSILGVARETKDFPELWQEFKNQATLALAPIGAQLMPKIGDAILKLTGYLQDAIDWWNGLSTETQAFIQKAILVAAAVGPVLMITAKLITVFQALAPILGIVRTAWVVLNAAFAMSPIGMIVIALGALVAGLVLAYQHSETFRNIVNGAFGAVRDFAGAALDWIIDKAKTWGPYLLGALGGPVGLVVVAVIKHWDEVKAGTSRVWNAVVDFVKAIPGKLLGFFLNWTIAGRIIKHWDDIKAGTTKAWNAVVDFVKAIPGKLLGFFLNWTIAGRIIKHWDDAKDGTIRVATSIVNWVADLPGKIVGKLSDLGGRLGSLASEAFGRLREAASNKVDGLMTFVKSIPGRIKGAFSGAKTLLSNIGRQIVDGLASGIRNAADKVLGAAESLIDKIPGPIRKAMGIASPSKVMIEIGKQIVAGLVKGLAGDTSDLKSAVDAINGLIEKAADKRWKKDKDAAAATRKIITGLRDERAELLKNGREHDRMSQRLGDARDKLRGLVAEAKAYARSIRDAIVDYGNITQYADAETGEVTAAGVIAGMREKLDRARAYNESLQKLASMGLSKTLLQQLTDAGVDGGLATAQALLDGGESAVAEVNKLNGKLVKVGKDLGGSMSETMHGAGIDAAQSLVNGLKKKTKALEKTGRNLAKAFTKALQDELSEAKLTVPIPAIKIEDTYAKSASSRTASARTTTDAAATQAGSAALLDAVEGLRAEVATVRTAVETQPYTQRDLARQSGR